MRFLHLWYSTCLLQTAPGDAEVFGCVQTTANVLQFFALRTSKQDAVPHLAHSTAHSANGTSAQPELKRMELFLERSVLIEGSAMAADIVGDSRAIVVSSFYEAFHHTRHSTM